MRTTTRANSHATRIRLARSLDTPPPLLPFESKIESNLNCFECACAFTDLYSRKTLHVGGGAAGLTFIFVGGVGGGVGVVSGWDEERDGGWGLGVCCGGVSAEGRAPIDRGAAGRRAERESIRAPNTPDPTLSHKPPPRYLPPPPYTHTHTHKHRRSNCTQLKHKLQLQKEIVENLPKEKKKKQATSSTKSTSMILRGSEVFRRRQTDESSQGEVREIDCASGSNSWTPTVSKQIDK